jgi:CRP-like cAMP-binding protein
MSKKEISKRYIELATLGAGKSFGDLALIGSKPRMASIRCVEDTHFAVLSKQDYNLILGQIEKKKLNEKIQFLRSSPFFSQLTKTSISKLTYQFREMPMIKN